GKRQGQGQGQGQGQSLGSALLGSPRGAGSAPDPLSTRKALTIRSGIGRAHRGGWSRALYGGPCCGDKGQGVSQTHGSVRLGTGDGAAPPRVPVRERSRPRARPAPARLTSHSSQPTSARGASRTPPPAPSLPIKAAAGSWRGTGVRGTGRDGRDGAAGPAPGTAARPRPPRRAGAPLASRDAACGRRAPARRSCGRAGVAGPGAGEPAGQPLCVHLAAAGRRRRGLPAAPRAHAGRRAAPRGGAESHGAAAAGDRPAAEGDHREPAGSHPGAHRQAEPLRGGRRQVRHGGVEERGGQGQGHDGRPAAGPGAGHRAAEPYHADPEGPPGEPGGNSAFKSPDEFKVSLPLRTNYLYGKIKKTLPELYAFTVCLWLRSSASPGIGTPFSYAVPGQANEIVLIEWGNNPIELLINDKVAQLPLFISDGKWHHICITWTTRDGMWEAFQDGEKLGTGENLAPWHPIKPGGVLILGQEQDTVGGRFDATQAFVGEMSQFNIWDRVLRAEDIMNIANCSINMPGNIIPWVDNNVDVFGGATKWPVETCEERLLDL
uniref:Neuronal pentraxin 2 n=2 Tax=Passerellidae TaxID=1729112 RepID=A0A8C5IT06_JUNHY